MFVYKVVLENTQKKISRAKNSKLFVKIFHARCKNTIASIFTRKYARIFVLGRYLFLVINSFRSLNFCPCTFLRENVDIDEKCVPLYKQ